MCYNFLGLDFQRTRTKATTPLNWLSRFSQNHWTASARAVRADLSKISNSIEDFWKLVTKSRNRSKLLTLQRKRRQHSSIRHQRNHKEEPKEETLDKFWNSFLPVEIVHWNISWDRGEGNSISEISIWLYQSC